MATTPSSSAIRTPPSPLHGARHDAYQPYSTRKSTRSNNSQSARSIHTPPPIAESHNTDTLSPPTTLKKAAKNRTSTNTLSTPPSTRSSPYKTSNSQSSRNPARIAGRRRPANTGVSPAGSDNSELSSMPPNAATNAALGMLPTPIKTPHKRPIQATAALKSTARVLSFDRPESVESSMPSPRKKKSKKHIGFTLDSFSDGQDGMEDQKDIKIFTDSKERIPEVDESEDNPFYDRPGRTPRKITSPKPSKRSKIMNNPKEQERVEETVKSNEGVLYVFRGKKFFRKFSNDAEEEDEDIEMSDTGVMGSNDIQTDRTSTNSHGHFTRSSIKPRLLFPNKAQQNAREHRSFKPTAPSWAVPWDEADEEALTDIEDPHLRNEAVKSGHSKVCHETAAADFNISADDMAEDITQTVSSANSGPLSIEVAPKAEKISPFAYWKVTKAGAAKDASSTLRVAGKGRKREGSLSQREKGTEKRTKSAL